MVKQAHQLNGMCAQLLQLFLQLPGALLSFPQLLLGGGQLGVQDVDLGGGVGQQMGFKTEGS